MTTTPIPQAAVADLITELRDQSQTKMSEAWRRLDGGHDISIGAGLADRAAAAIEAQAVEIERLRSETNRLIKINEGECEQKYQLIADLLDKDGQIEARDAAIARLNSKVGQMEAALRAAEETLALSERIPIRDPQHHAAIDRLGQEIGYGALMAGVQRAWRERLAETGFPMGGEFVAGPCYATVTATLTTIRAARAIRPDACVAMPPDGR